MSILKPDSANSDEKLVNVFFDGNCPLCRREMDFYRSLQAPSFRWTDVSDPNIDLTRWGINRTDALKELHAIDKNGNTQVGVDAFISIWKEFPKLKWLGFLISAPMIYQMASCFYLVFIGCRALWRK